jgi:hypothetical protein
MEKWFIPGPNERKYKMSPKYFMVPRSKKVIRRHGGKPY